MPDETTTVVDGIETNLPAEAVADLQPKAAEPATPEAKPEEGKEPEAKPAEEPKPEPTREPAKEPEGKPIEAKPKKAGPFADLLAKKHEAETRAETVAKENEELKRQLAKLSEAPASPQATDKVKALAEKYGLEAEVLSDIIATAREGMNPNPELPQEVRDLIAENNMRKAQETETAAFNRRVDSLAKAIPGEPIREHKERLMELAYSDEMAPDGERYADKELAEIYFTYIRPEVEPGKASGEAKATSGTKAAAPVMDFQEIFDRDDPKDVEAMDGPTFSRYSAWMASQQGDVKITRQK